MKKNRLLAFDPGTLHFGYAAFEDSELVDFGVRNIKQGSLPIILNHVEAIVDRMLREKQPTVLVYEKNQFSEATRNHRIVHVCGRIETVAKRHRVKVVPYHARTIRRIVTGNGNARKSDAAKAIAIRFPETRPYLKGHNGSQVRYFANALDAVAGGLAHLTQTQQQSRQWLERFMGRSGGKR
jgi:Holliday junction resolvasome RuvABC endonuclease subunit